MKVDKSRIETGHSAVHDYLSSLDLRLYSAPAGSHDLKLMGCNARFDTFAGFDSSLLRKP